MRVPACTLTLLAGVLASWLSWLSVCVSEKGKAKVLFQEPCSQSWLHPSCAPGPSLLLSRVLGGQAQPSLGTRRVRRGLLVSFQGRGQAPANTPSAASASFPLCLGFSSPLSQAKTPAACLPA